MTTQREFITEIIECFPLDEDGTGHIVDCGYTEAHERCGCAAVPGKLADLLAVHDREVAAKALREARAEIADLGYRTHSERGDQVSRFYVLLALDHAIDRSAS